MNAEAIVHPVCALQSDVGAEMSAPCSEFIKSPITDIKPMTNGTPRMSRQTPVIHFHPR